MHRIAGPSNTVFVTPEDVLGGHAPSRAYAMKTGAGGGGGGAGDRATQRRFIQKQGTRHCGTEPTLRVSPGIRCFVCSLMSSAGLHMEAVLLTPSARRLHRGETHRAPSRWGGQRSGALPRIGSSGPCHTNFSAQLVVAVQDRALNCVRRPQQSFDLLARTIPPLVPPSVPVCVSPAGLSAAPDFPRHDWASDGDSGIPPSVA